MAKGTVFFDGRPISLQPVVASHYPTEDNLHPPTDLDFREIGVELLAVFGEEAIELPVSLTIRTLSCVTVVVPAAFALCVAA